MLRLKQVMDELGIPQKALVNASGFGKSQVSLTLNKGVLPVDAGKFIAGVTKLLDYYPRLQTWLTDNNVLIEELCLPVPDATAKPATGANLERALCEIAGQAVLMASVPRETVIGLARATGHLLDQLRSLNGADTPYTLRIESEACALLTERR